MIALRQALCTISVVVLPLCAEGALRLELVARGLESAVAFVPDPLFPTRSSWCSKTGWCASSRAG